MDSLSILPDEILLEIIGFLTIMDRLNLSGVSHRFHEIMSDEIIWKRSYLQNFSAPKSENSSWMAVYRDRHVAKHRLTNQKYHLKEFSNGLDRNTSRYHIGPQVYDFDNNVYISCRNGVGNGRSDLDLYLVDKFTSVDKEGVNDLISQRDCTNHYEYMTTFEYTRRIKTFGGVIVMSGDDAFNHASDKIEISKMQISDDLRVENVNVIDTGHKHGISHFGILDSDKIATTGHYSRLAKIFELTGHEILQFPIAMDKNISVLTCCQNEMIVANYEDAAFWIYDVRNPAIPQFCDLPSLQADPDHIVYQPDRYLIVCYGMTSRKIVCFDTRTRKCLSEKRLKLINYGDIFKRRNMERLQIYDGLIVWDFDYYYYDCLSSETIWYRNDICGWDISDVVSDFDPEKYRILSDATNFEIKNDVLFATNTNQSIIKIATF